MVTKGHVQIVLLVWSYLKFRTMMGSCPNLAKNQVCNYSHLMMMLIVHILPNKVPLIHAFLCALVFLANILL